MKLNKEQALMTFTALELIAVAIGLLLAFTNPGATVSYWILSGVIAVCEFGKYKARQMKEEVPVVTNPVISSGGSKKEEKTEAISEEKQ